MEKKPKATKAQLKRQVFELKAQLLFALKFAEIELDSFSQRKLMASGVILRLDSLGGHCIMNPVMIRDGLSQKTIDAIKEDLERSYDIATMKSIAPKKKED